MGEAFRYEDLIDTHRMTACSTHGRGSLPGRRDDDVRRWNEKKPSIGYAIHLVRHIAIHDETRESAPGSILTARHDWPLTTEAIAVVFRHGTPGR